MCVIFLPGPCRADDPLQTHHAEVKRELGASGAPKLEVKEKVRDLIVAARAIDDAGVDDSPSAKVQVTESTPPTKKEKQMGDTERRRISRELLKKTDYPKPEEELVRS